MRGRPSGPQSDGDGVELSITVHYREIVTCGGCTWLVVGGSPGALVKNGTCEADCSPSCWWGSNCLDLSDKAIGSISEGAFLGLPQLQALRIWDNEIQAISEGAFLGLPLLQTLSLLVTLHCLLLFHAHRGQRLW